MGSCVKVPRAGVQASTMEISIRAADPTDAGGVASVYLKSRKRFLPFAPLAHSDAEVQRWISRSLIPTGQVLVAEGAGGIVGMMAISVEGGISWIDHLYLEPESVGRGIGSRLLDFGLTQLDPPIRAQTFEANFGARRFYERHGFVPISHSDGADNEERCPDVLYERPARRG